MDGWKENKNMKKIDGWMDGQKQNRKIPKWKIGWIEKYGWLDG